MTYSILDKVKKLKSTSTAPKAEPEETPDNDHPTIGDFTPFCKVIPNRVFSFQDKRIDFDDLSQDQADVLEALTYRARGLGPGQITSLGGYAGTGKSTIIPLLAENLGSLSTTAFACFTGKAAQVLKRKLEVAGIRREVGAIGTIHSLIYEPILDHRGIVIDWKRRAFLMPSDQNLKIAHETCTRVIIDEASMVGKVLLNDLLSFGVPVILVGDHGQLPPVKDDSCIKTPEFTLEKIHRQAAENPIIKLSQIIREQRKIPKDFQECEEIQFITPKEMDKVVSEGFDQHGLDFGLLVRSNRVRCNYNINLADGVIPKEGHIVICLKNNPPIFNGMRGEITIVEPVYKHWYRVAVSFPDDGLELNSLVNLHQFGRADTIESVWQLYDEVQYPRSCEDLGLLFDFGMAITVHKAQGSAFESMVLCPEHYSFDEKDGGKEFAKWLYTGATRAAKKLYILRR